MTYDSGDGHRIPTGDLASATLTFKGGKMASNQEGSPLQNATVTWDFESTPMRLIIPSACGKTIPGIIKFEGEQFHWCHGDAESAPPSAFVGGKGYHSMIYKRVGK